MPEEPLLTDPAPTVAVTTTATDRDGLVHVAVTAGTLTGLQIDAALLKNDYREVAEVVRTTINEALRKNTAALLVAPGANLDLGELRGALRGGSEQAQDLLAQASDAHADALQQISEMGASDPNREVSRG